MGTGKFRMAVRFSGIAASWLLSAIACSAERQAGVSDWPCYRGHRGDAIVEDERLAAADLASGFRKLWSVPLPDEQSADTGPSYARYNTYSGPVVSGGKVYAPCRMGGKDVLSCFDAVSGALLWRHTIEPPAPKDGAGGKENTGKEYGTGIRAAPLVHGDLVYVLDYHGRLFCIGRDEGRLVWKRDLVSEFRGRTPPFGASASPVIIDGMLIVQPGGPGAAVAASHPCGLRGTPA